ncbi:MAG: isoprenylcysteine carboxylmethyltransferase family protein [Candidatus Krumholzibacteria bacterium]|nr:isoprenylcysteine carboxylmethyltransferase family protein [Candidatus Krumholzibacteria bacterium]
MKSPSNWARARTIAGWVGITVFVVIYAAELVPRQGPPVTIAWIREVFGRTGLIILNIVIVLSFIALLPYRRPTKARWKSHGAFIAFVIALMTEMFGWPLLIFLLSPVVEVPSLMPKLHRAAGGHWPAIAGTIMSLLGVALIAIGWLQIHRATGLVSTGLYRFIRHPQYTGLFLFTAGWILHWPSVITLAIWPILMAAYVWLAVSEEREGIETFGEEYVEYKRRSKRFVPFVV